MSDPGTEKATHTPGPWRVSGKGTILAGKNTLITTVHWDNRSPNASLIAAAPALLMALEEIISANKEFRDGMPDEWEGDPLQDAIESGRSALALAKGEACPVKDHPDLYD